MLKYIGICLAAAGLLLFIYAEIAGRKKGIKKDKEELKMITGAGYASEHVAEKKERAPFERQAPQRKKKRKRDLNEESRSILELVEKERAEKNAEYSVPKQEPKPKKPKKRTDVLGENGSGRKYTDTLPSDIEKQKSKGTDILTDKDITPKKGTDVLRIGADTLPKKGTDVLQESARPKAGTDILKEPQPTRKKGTDILTDKSVEVTEKAQKKGTDILTEKRQGTDVLTGERTGTDVLREKPTKRGTDVLEARED